MNAVVVETIEEWLKDNEVLPESSSPNSIAALVQQHYYALLKSKKFKTEEIEALAEGKEPTRNQLYIINSVITSLSQSEIFELHKKTFGHLPVSNEDRAVERKQRSDKSGNS